MWHTHPVERCSHCNLNFWPLTNHIVLHVIFPANHLRCQSERIPSRLRAGKSFQEGFRGTDSFPSYMYHKHALTPRCSAVHFSPLPYSLQVHVLHHPQHCGHESGHHGAWIRPAAPNVSTAETREQLWNTHFSCTGSGAFSPGSPHSVDSCLSGPACKP